MVPLPVSSTTFQEIFTTLKIPHVFLRVLLSNLPIALRFVPNADKEVTGGGTVPQY
jgi:hypothetical protein